MDAKYLDYRLCYVDSNLRCYFTDNFDDQWGDDWDDAPYQYNAEPPYADADHHIYILALDNGRAYDMGVSTPDECDDSQSVSAINAGVRAWITVCDYRDNDKRSKLVCISGGTTVREFIDKLKDSVVIYEPINFEVREMKMMKNGKGEE